MRRFFVSLVAVCLAAVCLADPFPLPKIPSPDEIKQFKTFRVPLLHPSGASFTSGQLTGRTSQFHLPNHGARVSDLIDRFIFHNAHAFVFAGENQPTGEYLAGSNRVSLVCNPRFPLRTGVFVALPTAPLSLSVTCLKGPLFSGLNGTCAGSASVPNATGPPTTYSTQITESPKSIQVFSATGSSTTPIIPNTPLIFLLPETPSPFGFHIDTIDPISTATGGLRAGPFEDLSLGGPLPLAFRRSYESAIGATFGQNAIGYNWTTNFDTYLGLSSGFAVVAMEGGGTVTFQLTGGVYKLLYAPRLAYQLVQKATGYRFLNPEENRIYDYDLNGALTRIEDRNGNALTITRAADGTISQVSDGLGRTLSFTYAVQGNAPILTKVQDQSGRVVSFGYDAAFNLTSFTDANGISTAYSYSGNLLTKITRPLGNAPYTQAFDPNTGAAISQTDSQGNTTKLSFVNGGTAGATKLTDPLGRSTSFSYGDSSLVDVTGEVDAAGNSSAVSYDAAGRPSVFTDRLGNMTTIVYDAASGYPATETDAAGNTVTYTYQAQVQGDFTFYNLAKIAYPDGTSVTFTYDASGNVLTETDQAGKKTTLTYNARGDLVTETNPANGVRTFTYGNDETMASMRVPSGDLYAFTYDGAKRVIGIQNPDSTQISFHYDALDNVLQVIDERSRAASATFDTNANLRTVTDALLKSSSIAYDTDDLPNLFTDRLGNQTRVQYDALGSIVGVTNGAGEKTSYTYDNLERVQSILDSTNKATATFGYDAEGRLTSATDAAGNVTRAQVDKDGRTTQVTSPLGENTSFTYDSMSRITSTGDPLGGQYSIVYEARGLPATLAAPGGISTMLGWGDLPVINSLTDPNGSAWTIGRDGMGRATSTTDPLGQVTRFAYTARNQIASVTSPIDSAKMTYDDANRLTQIQYSDAVTSAFSYDDDNRLTSATNVALAYDSNGSMTGSNGLVIARDAVGRISSITYGPGKTVNYLYDPRGLLANVTDWMGASVKFTFDDAHRLTAETRTNGVITSYTYDKDSRVQTLVDVLKNTTLGSITFSRDPLGRVTTATRLLPQEAAPGPPAQSSSSFDAASQIAGASYDARGRIVNDNAGATYQWTASSRLASYARPDGSASATYDALGMRISRTVKNGATQNYVIDYATGMPTLAIVQAGDSDVRYYVYTPGGALLFSVDAVTGAHHFYSFDETGSTTMLTDDAGNVTDTYGISPYGEVVTPGPGNATDNPFTWQGQWGVMQEGAGKLFYARYRYYDAANARFLSRDPFISAAPRELNPYPYAAGNPAANVDPLGLKPKPNLDVFDYSAPAFLSNGKSAQTIMEGTSAILSLDNLPGDADLFLRSRFSDSPKLPIDLPSVDFDQPAPDPGRAMLGPGPDAQDTSYLPALLASEKEIRERERQREQDQFAEALARAFYGYLGSAVPK